MHALLELQRAGKSRVSAFVLGVIVGGGGKKREREREGAVPSSGMEEADTSKGYQVGCQIWDEAKALQAVLCSYQGGVPRYHSLGCFAALDLWQFVHFCGDESKKGPAEFSKKLTLSAIATFAI